MTALSHRFSAVAHFQPAPASVLPRPAHSASAPMMCSHRSGRRSRGQGCGGRPSARRSKAQRYAVAEVSCERHCRGLQVGQVQQARLPQRGSIRRPQRQRAPPPPLLSVQRLLWRPLSRLTTVAPLCASTSRAQRHATRPHGPCRVPCHTPSLSDERPRTLSQTCPSTPARSRTV